jgi:hypothetical protein
VAKGEKHIVVLRDDAGDIYLFDHHALEQMRVPKERAAEVEQALKGSAIDVSLAVDKRKVAEGGLRLQSSKAATYNIVGSYTLQHTGGLSIAEILRAL